MKPILKYSKLLFFLNIVLILLFASYIIYKKINYGYVFERDISLKGGITIIFKDKGYNLEKIKEVCSNCNYYKTGGFIYIEGKNINISKILEIYNLSKQEVSIQEFNPYFGNIIFKEFTKLIIISFILIAIIIFIRMKSLISSIAIILTILFDLLGIIFILALINFPITPLTFVAFLMILGYAIDNNIVLATNMLKEEGSFEDKAKSALKIGYLMEFTTILVLVIMLFTIKSKVIFEISFVLTLSLLLDAYFYLFGNIPFYYLTLEKKELLKSLVQK